MKQLLDESGVPTEVLLCHPLLSPQFGSHSCGWHGCDAWE